MNESVAVVGAGLAGVTCATHLARAGVPVTVYEKSSGAGGRMATRRALGTAFDHGAQYFTVRDPGFAQLLAPLRAGQVVAPFAPRWGRGAPDDPQLFVGSPGMAAPAKALAAGLNLIAPARVTRLDRVREGWQLGLEDGAGTAAYGRVVLALPAPQVCAIGGLPAALGHVLGAVELQPCLALMAAPAQPLPLAWDVDWQPDPVLPFVCRNSAKPGRDAREAWVLHADGDYSAAHFDTPAVTVAADLRAAFGRRTGVALTDEVPWDLQRWRYARVVHALGEPYAFDAASGIGACGDWCLDARVEAAYLSGAALASRLLAAA